MLAEHSGQLLVHHTQVLQLGLHVCVKSFDGRCGRHRFHLEYLTATEQTQFERWRAMTKHTASDDARDAASDTAFDLGLMPVFMASLTGPTALSLFVFQSSRTFFTAPSTSIGMQEIVEPTQVYKVVTNLCRRLEFAHTQSTEY